MFTMNSEVPMDAFYVSHGRLIMNDYSKTIPKAIMQINEWDFIKQIGNS